MFITLQNQSALSQMTMVSKHNCWQKSNASSWCSKTHIWHLRERQSSLLHFEKQVCHLWRLVLECFIRQSSILVTCIYGLLMWSLSCVMTVNTLWQQQFSEDIDTGFFSPVCLPFGACLQGITRARLQLLCSIILSKAKMEMQPQPSQPVLLNFPMTR